MTREEAIKQCRDFIKNHSDWSAEEEWANGVEYVLEDYKRLTHQEDYPSVIGLRQCVDDICDRAFTWRGFDFGEVVREIYLMLNYNYKEYIDEKDFVSLNPAMIEMSVTKGNIEEALFLYDKYRKDFEECKRGLRKKFGITKKQFEEWEKNYQSEE